MKKFAAVILAVLLLAAAAVFFGIRLHHGIAPDRKGQQGRTDVQTLDFSGKELPDFAELTQYPHLKTLDLRDTGLTVQQYEQLKDLLPECEILWLVPFQEQYLPADTQTLTIHALEAEDIPVLAYFPRLEAVDASSCEDLDAVLQLRQSYPDCIVTYQVTIGGQPVSQDTETLEIADADPEELIKKLKYLPRLKTVSFSGKVPKKEAIYAVKEACPDIDCLWTFQLFDREVSSNAAELDFSGIKMESVALLEENLKYFNHLEKVILCDCGLPSEELDALWKRHPETRFVWNVKVGDHMIRTDVTTFMPFQLGYEGGSSSERLHDSQCTEMKYLVDIVCMDLGHMAIRDISFVQYMPNLEYLLLCGNGISDFSPLAGLEKLKYLEGFANSVKDISALAQCPALEDVNLCYNPIEDLTPLMELKNLNNIWLSGWQVDQDQLQQLRQVHSNAKIVTDSPRSTGEGWRDLPNYFAQRDLLGMWYMTTD